MTEHQPEGGVAPHHPLSLFDDDDRNAVVDALPQSMLPILRLAMADAALAALEPLVAAKIAAAQKLSAAVVDDFVTLYHPEFGSHWREPEGAGWKLQREARHVGWKAGVEDALKIMWATDYSANDGPKTAFDKAIRAYMEKATAE